MIRAGGAQRMLYPVPSPTEEKVAFIDAEGEVLLEVFGRKGFGFLETRAFVARNDQLILINKDGQELAHIRADRARTFVNGFCVVEKLDSRTRRLLKGLVDSAGQWVAEPIYANISEVDENHYARREAETDLYSLFRVRGNLVLDAIGLSPSPVAEDVIAVGTADDPGKLGYKRLDNTWLVEPAFDTARPFFCGVAPVIKRAKRHYNASFIGKDGADVVTLPGIESFGERFSDGVIGFHGAKADGFLDKAGNRVCEGRFQILGLMQHGAAPVKSQGKWGLIGKDGRWLHKPAFSRLHEQQGPFFAFRNGPSFDALTVLNARGKVIWQHHAGKF